MKKATHQKRRLEGTVVSTKMQKTAVVRVDRTLLHSKYKKYFKVSKRYKVHDETNACVKGDVVVIEECRPIAKDKCWRIVERQAKKEVTEKE